MPRTRLALALLALSASSSALAQSDAAAPTQAPAPTLLLDPDAGATAAPALVLDPDAAATGDSAVVEAPAGGCQSDLQPAGHAVRIESRVEPAQPTVGDRVRVVYRLIHVPSDRVEFEPDPAAFAQPDHELEYARVQPDRDRGQYVLPGGQVYGEVTVAVQPFKIGELVIAPQLARVNAAGEVLRVCTPAVRFRVRDPFGNASNPVPRDLTAPEAVREDSLRWRYVAVGLDAAFALIAGTVLVNDVLRRRPRAVVPPPPPRPAWIVAIEQLDAVSRSDLLSRGATKDYYDSISDIVRRYLGGSRGFDALEMTTDEVLRTLKRNPLQGVADAELAHLLGDCDLVKFARYVPTHEESEEVLERAYAVVRKSSPAPGAPEKPAAEKSKPAVERPEQEKRA